MPGKQAKVVTPPMLKRMLRHVSRSSFPTRDRAMILLSIKAGFRACEIAGLDWAMVLDPQGRVSATINVRDVIAKRRGIAGFLCIRTSDAPWNRWPKPRSRSGRSSAPIAART